MSKTGNSKVDQAGADDIDRQTQPNVEQILRQKLACCEAENRNLKKLVLHHVEMEQDMVEHLREFRELFLQLKGMDIELDDLEDDSSGDVSSQAISDTADLEVGKEEVADEAETPFFSKNDEGEDISDEVEKTSPNKERAEQIPSQLPLKTEKQVPTNNDIRRKTISSMPKIQFPVGTRVRKLFSAGYFEGEVVAYDKEMKWYRIMYVDGDEEELDYEEVMKLRLL